MMFLCGVSVITSIVFFSRKTNQIFDFFLYLFFFKKKCLKMFFFVGSLKKINRKNEGGEKNK